MTARPSRWICSCALALALGAGPARAGDEQKPPAGLGLDDLDALPAKKAKPAKAKPKAERPAKAGKPAAPPQQKAPAPAETPGVFVATPPPAAPVPAPAPAPAASPAPKPGPAGAPPLLKLATQYGITLPRNGLVDEATAADIESGLKTIAFGAPMSARPLVLHAPQAPCGIDDDACFAALGAQEGVDEVVVASLSRAANALALRVRRIDVLTRKVAGETSQASLSAQRQELKAWAEALLCRQLIPAGCTGELVVEAGDAALESAGKPLAKGDAAPARVRLPVGVQPLRAVRAGKAGPERLVPVLKEPATGVQYAVRDAPEGPRLVSPGEPEPAPAIAARAAPAAATAAPAPPPAAGPRWTRVAGTTVAAVGAAALVGGLVQGARSKSLISSAESAYNANGGAWRTANLDDLRSGNSAAKSANLLFAAGAAMAALGLVVAFAF